MKSIGADKQENKASKSNEAEKCDQIATKEEKIDFSNVKIEPLFEEEVDFDTFSKSDFRAVKVKECVAVPKSKKLLQFTLDDGTGRLTPRGQRRSSKATLRSTGWSGTSSTAA